VIGNILINNCVGGEMTCSDAKKTIKVYFNELWSKIPKESDEFGNKKMITITTTKQQRQ
jgi:hypothetical protein